MTIGVTNARLGLKQPKLAATLSFAGFVLRGLEEARAWHTEQGGKGCRREAGGGGVPAC